ncbi:MAG: hypothetical protein QOH93_1035 [Chloroflexia bacterium]|jgi:hypothetical protein|nr:hypothetical protein [Chloroflexia bacterium]
MGNSNGSNNSEQEIEDYGTSDSAGGSGSAFGSSGGQGAGESGGGGATGVERPGPQFGEFGETGSGTDLTVEMEGFDARTGSIKGGQEGADDAAGPGQYGGASGGLGSSNRS